MHCPETQLEQMALWKTKQLRMKWRHSLKLYKLAGQFTKIREREAAMQNQDMQTVISYVMNGWIVSSTVPNHLKTGVSILDEAAGLFVTKQLLEGRTHTLLQIKWFRQCSWLSEALCTVQSYREVFPKKAVHVCISIEFTIHKCTIGL